MEGEGICPNTIIVLGNQNAYNNNSGSLQVIGGASIRKNVNVGGELIANKIVCANNIIIGGELHICGTIHCDEIFKINEKNITFRYNLLPDVMNNNSNERISLGTNEKKFEEINGKQINSSTLNSYSVSTSHLDVKNNVSIGCSKDKKESLIEINDNSMVTQLEIFILSPKTKTPLLSTNIENNRLYINNTQIITPTDDKINVTHNIVLLDLKEIYKNIYLDIQPINLNNELIKIVIVNNPNNIQIEIINKTLQTEGDTIELVIWDDKMICLR